MVLWKLGILMPKNELPHKNQQYTKLNSKLIMDLNVRAETVKCVKESTEGTSWPWIRQRVVRCNTKSMWHNRRNW